MGSPFIFDIINKNESNEKQDTSTISLEMLVEWMRCSIFDVDLKTMHRKWIVNEWRKAKKWMENIGLEWERCGGQSLFAVLFEFQPKIDDFFFFCVFNLIEYSRNQFSSSAVAWSKTLVFVVQLDKCTLRTYDEENREKEWKNNQLICVSTILQFEGPMQEKKVRVKMSEHTASERRDWEKTSERIDWEKTN